MGRSSRSTPGLSRVENPQKSAGENPLPENDTLGETLLESEETSTRKSLEHGISRWRIHSKKEKRKEMDQLEFEQLNIMSGELFFNSSQIGYRNSTKRLR